MKWLKRQNWPLIAALVYTAGAWATFVYAYNAWTVRDPCRAAKTCSEFITPEEMARGGHAVGAGLWWPLYWSMWR